jgi:hypothetical protein
MKKTHFAIRKNVFSLVLSFLAAPLPLHFQDDL